MTAYADQDSAAPVRADGAKAEPAPPAGATDAPAAADGEAVEGQATGADSAPPADAPSFFSGTTLLLFALPLMLVFLMSRNQNKKQQKLEESLTVGDRVVTRAGMVGKILEIGERQAKLEIAPGVNVMFLKTAIEGVDGGDKAADAKKADGKAEKSEKGAAKKDADKDTETAAPAKLDGKSKNKGKERPSEKRA